jgi:hypothetical protein
MVSWNVLWITSSPIYKICSMVSNWLFTFVFLLPCDPSSHKSYWSNAKTKQVRRGIDGHDDGIHHRCCYYCLQECTPTISASIAHTGPPSTCRTNSSLNGLLHYSRLWRYLEVLPSIQAIAASRRGALCIATIQEGIVHVTLWWPSPPCRWPHNTIRTTLVRMLVLCGMWF